MSAAENFMKCPACGAVNRIDRDTTCWVCDQPLDLKKSVWIEFYEGQEPPAPSTGFGAGGCLMGMVFLLVAVGLTLVAPGLGIMLIVFSIIPLIRTLYLVDPAKDPGKAFSLYVSSVVVSIVIVTVLGVVAFGAFCLSLFGVCMFEPRGGSEALSLGIVGLVTLSAVVATGIPLVKWVIHRYRRDSADR